VSANVVDPRLKNERRRRGSGMPRPTTQRRITRATLRAFADLLGPVDDLPTRPRTRAECVGSARPCPYVSCRHHLYLEVTEAGSLKLNFPHLEPDELVESCALDVAERGGATLDAVGLLINLTRERVRQIERPALLQLRAEPTFASEDPT